MDYSTILYDVDDGILTITLNRPEALNSFTDDMRVELVDACDRADADDNVEPSLSPAQVAASVPRRTCPVAALPSISSKREDRKKDGINQDGGGRLTLRLYELTKPIITAVNGPAVGVGVTMTLAMDIRIAYCSRIRLCVCTARYRA